MVKDFKRWTTQLAATVLYNGRGAANLLGADMTWKNVCLPGVNCGYCRYAEAGCPWGLTLKVATKEPSRACQNSGPQTLAPTYVAVLTAIGPGVI